jgi:MFS family permease
MILLPIFANDVLEVGVQGFGAMEAAAGVGAIGGTLLVIKFGTLNKIGMTILICSALFGISLMIFSLTKILIFSMFTLMIAGMFQSIYLNFSMTAIQLMVPDELRGRVMSVYTTTYFLISIGGFLSGTLAAAISVPTTILIFSFIVFIFSVLLSLLLPQVRHLEFEDIKNMNN